ncbi:RNase H domain-containing protein [Trichonephila clavipes]|nr:RNase H domain-containing protein [Trichonephila clavipes]
MFILWSRDPLKVALVEIHLIIRLRGFDSRLSWLLALEIIDGIPSDAIKIYTDGSRLSDRAGSAIYFEKRGERSFCHRNLDFSSVFKSDLISIGHGIEAVLNEQDFGDLSVLSDSRSSLQQIYNWITVGDKAGVSILQKQYQYKYQSPMIFISSGFHPMLTSLEMNKRIYWLKRVVMLLHLSLQPSPTLNINIGINLKF